MKPHPKTQFTRRLAPGSAVLDVGCWTYSYFRHCEQVGVKGLKHAGIDRERPKESLPKDYDFAVADVDRDPFPFPSESFDVVVLSHVIEHLSRPLGMMDEVFRVLKPGGLVYLECPSDRSQRLPSMPFKFHEFRCLNFYDDPTHVGRPYSPQSIYRLFSMYGAAVEDCRYITSWAVRVRFPWLLLQAWLRKDAALLEFAVWWTFGFAAYGVARKSAEGNRSYRLSA